MGNGHEPECNCECEYTRKSHSTIDVAANNWKKILFKISYAGSYETHDVYYMAPNGTIFKSLMQIRHYFVIMSGITVGLDYLLTKINVLPSISVDNQEQLEDIRTNVGHQLDVYFERTFGDSESGQIEKVKKNFFNICDNGDMIINKLIIYSPTMLSLMWQSFCIYSVNNERIFGYIWLFFYLFFHSRN